MLTRNLQDILAAGYAEVGLTPTASMPGYGFMRKHKVHQSYRLDDGLWHYFRFIDPVKAGKRDEEFNQPMLPKANQNQNSEIEN